MRRHFPLFVAVAVACLCATGCDSDDASKAGGSVPPLTLRLGTPDPAGRASDPSIREFARQVEERSGGELRIEIDWGDQFGNIPEWDQRVARKVVDGELDMGLIPARAWDTEGVTTLRALHAPFLVTDDSLLREITRGPLADEMLAGLDEAGVVGLALVPEALRHPVGFDRPLASPADFRGAALRVPVSETSYALFRSLGAVPRDLDGDEFTRAVQDRSVRGTEASYDGVEFLPGRPLFTGNVTLYPKVNSLVIDRDVHDDLTDRQRDVLAASADAALAAVGEEAATDAEMAAEFCRAGGTIVAAPPSAVRALNRAATPVYAELARDERTKRIVQAILELKSSRTGPAEARRPCGDLNAPREAAATRVGPGIPDGVYRTTMSAEELVAAGFASSLEDPTEYDGVHTLTLNRGDLVDYIPSGGEFVPCGGTYSSAGNRVKFRFEVDCSGEMTARWSLRDGWLRFTRVTSDNPVNTSNLRAVFGAKPFRKLD